MALKRLELNCGHWQLPISDVLFLNATLIPSVARAGQATHDHLSLGDFPCSPFNPWKMQTGEPSSFLLTITATPRIWQPFPREVRLPESIPQPTLFTVSLFIYTPSLLESIIQHTLFTLS
jgi:hypothetical protein